MRASNRIFRLVAPTSVSQPSASMKSPAKTGARKLWSPSVCTHGKSSAPAKKAKKADAILVSQVVTQRDVHKDNSRAFIEAARSGGLGGKALLLLGGPRVDHKLALELGFDAGFGPGTKPSDVANFIVHALLKRLGKEPPGMHFEGEPT